MSISANSYSEKIKGQQNIADVMVDYVLRKYVEPWECEILDAVFYIFIWEVCRPHTEEIINTLTAAGVNCTVSTEIWIRVERVLVGATRE